jgi:ribonuclease D
MTIINNPKELQEACNKLVEAQYITVDTEFMRESTFWPQLCLIQIGGPKFAFAIDPLENNMNLNPVMELFANKNITKVMHAARQDMEIFYHINGKLPEPLFDTQIAAMVCGFGDQVGYEALISRLTGKKVDKSSRFTNWAHRPLTNEQIKYALADVTHLRDAYEILLSRIKNTGRLEWIKSEIDQLCNPKLYHITPNEAWKRLKYKRYEPRYLSVLQAAAAWRENEAMSRNIPRNRVLRDEIILQLAAKPPTDVSSLSLVRGLSESFTKSLMGDSLLKAISEGIKLPIELAPKAPMKTDLPSGIGPICDLLKVLLKLKCEEYHVAQKLVANSSDIERIAADDNADVPALKGWRRNLFGKEALKLKNGEIALSASGKSLKILNVDQTSKRKKTAPNKKQIKKV